MGINNGTLRALVGSVHVFGVWHGVDGRMEDGISNTGPHVIKMPSGNRMLRNQWPFKGYVRHGTTFMSGCIGCALDASWIRLYAVGVLHLLMRSSATGGLYMSKKADMLGIMAQMVIAFIHCTVDTRDRR